MKVSFKGLNPMPESILKLSHMNPADIDEETLLEWVNQMNLSYRLGKVQIQKSLMGSANTAAFIQKLEEGMEVRVTWEGMYAFLRQTYASPGTRHSFVLSKYSNLIMKESDVERLSRSIIESSERPFNDLMIKLTVIDLLETVYGLSASIADKVVSWYLGMDLKFQIESSNHINTIIYSYNLSPNVLSRLFKESRDYHQVWTLLNRQRLTEDIVNYIIRFRCTPSLKINSKNHEVGLIEALALNPNISEKTVNKLVSLLLYEYEPETSERSLMAIARLAKLPPETTLKLANVKILVPSLLKNPNVGDEMKVILEVV